MRPQIPEKLAAFLADVCICYAADRKIERVRHGSLVLTICANCGKPVRPRTRA